MTENTAKTSTIGLAASVEVQTLDWLRWYAHHVSEINTWLIHIAQIGGVVIMIYSILILRRNYHNGKKTTNPLDNKD